MKSSIIQLAKQVSLDRPFMMALITLTLVSLIFCGYVAFNLHPSELQVVTHYSAFGATNFYRDKWYYLIGFILFGLLNVGVYGALACKLFLHKGRSIAIPFAWLGVVVAIVAMAVLYQVLKVAALS
jgi:hypothetical protein